MQHPSTIAYLHAKLIALETVWQAPKYHPEGNALYHSLQVFQYAYQHERDPVLWTAALFHDIGKANDGPECHAQSGADDVQGILVQPVEWLIRHHLDLLKHPKRTRQRISGTRLTQLYALRRADLAGRKVGVEVMLPEQALAIVCAHPCIFHPDCC